jgi:hypothetical protein
MGGQCAESAGIRFVLGPLAGYNSLLLIWASLFIQHQPEFDCEGGTIPLVLMPRPHSGLAVRIRWTLAVALAVLSLGCVGHPRTASGPPAGVPSPRPESAPPPTPEPAPKPDNPVTTDSASKHAKKSEPGAREIFPAPPPPPPPVSGQPSAPVPAFQWPPPKASEEYVLPRSSFGDGSRPRVFSDVDRILVAALSAGGYTARSYYSVPNGFALATRIEQINDDGTPKIPPARFAIEPEPVSILRPMDYLKALLKGVPGYYRVIVFIVTDTPFQTSGKSPTEAQATEWVSSGVNVLPRAIGVLPFTPDVNCTALVYEFTRKPGADSDATRFDGPGRLDAMTHLVKSGIWRGFGQR